MSEKEQVIQALRATLISVKGALTVQQCNRDFKELQGEWIPYKKLGYTSLEKLFLDVPGFKVTQRNGEWYVDAIASQETQHIVSMIAKQKPSKKSRSKLTYPSRFPKRQDSWRKPASYNYSSNYSNQYSNEYYRPKGSTSNGSYGSYGYNNNHSIKNNNKYTKSSEMKTTTNYSKPNKPSSDYSETITTNTAPKAPPAAPPPTHNSIKQEAPARQQDIKFKPPGRAPDVEIKQSSKVSASQRLSTLRDRLNTVDLIPLQLPAVTNEYSESSGPVTLVTPAHHLEPPPDSTSSVARLEWTCQKLGLPQPVFRVHDHGVKRGPASYDCSVKVGSQYSATSYPNSSPSEQLAREVAAVLILGVIESSAAAGLPDASDSQAVSCLAELVSEHEAGLWASMVPHLYREKYGENLPSNWQELVENCPRIIKERVINGLILLPPNNEEPPSFYRDMSTVLMDDTLIEGASELPPLKFPEDSYWNVYVTVANSTLEVWLRIIGEEYSEALAELLAEMEQHYQHYGSIVDKSMIIQNAWYAVNLEEGGWQRAKLLEVDESAGAASVFLGDHGDDDVVLLHRIKILEPQFRKLPAQAILSRLEGAEELAASSEAAEMVRQRLLDQVLVAEPRPCDDPTEPAVSVVLYDTSTQRDLNLNREIINDFCTAGAFTITQKLSEVVVGCVTDEGRVWVSRCGGAALVRAALAVLTAGAYRRALPASPAAPPPPPPPHAPRPLYIVRTRDGDWVRCVIISGLDGEGTVRTQLVDSGLVLRAPLSSLVPLQEFSRALNTYPYQAICVRLGAAERACAAMAGRLRELLLNTRVICRALPAVSAAAAEPHVELFVRTEPQNILASVNNNILMEYDRQLGKPNEESISTTDHVEAIHRKKERVFRSSSAPDSAAAAVAAAAAAAAAAGAAALPPPALPRPGQCCDVHVAMAANPWNFVVQPNSTRHSLQSMMASLQIECPKLSETEAPLKPASGELYTVFYDKDSSWYRVVVAGAVSTDTVSVYFCDYGDLALFASRQLRPVPAAVPLARSLPPQAIKARLYDVLPQHQDWTVEDCIRFQELCVEQQFVGVCKEVGRDPLHAAEPLLTLDLIDTTTDEDVYLNQQLVTEGRARLASATAAATA